ncbi:MAG TPA: hypothetical protein VHT75_05710 [Acidimicrobiales bacterium]|jgi:uncharacterized membrane protein HdeD (DUF308 family)|nr:hypothetical protein [Acidimicrobiales bacterium]
MSPPGTGRDAGITVDDGEEIPMLTFAHASRTSLALRGLAALAFGVLTLLWPGVTVFVLVVAPVTGALAITWVVAWYAIISAIVLFGWAWQGPRDHGTAGQVVGGSGHVAAA